MFSRTGQDQLQRDFPIYSHKVKKMKSRNITRTERVGRQSHALWRYVDDLYGPLDRDVDVTAVRDLVSTPSLSRSIPQPALGPISSWRDRYGLPKNTYSKTESVLKELKETQKELKNQMDTNSRVAEELLTKIDVVVKKNESLKDQRHLSQNIEEKYMCRRLGQWNVDKYENEVREYEEKEDPRCHQCSRRQSELTGDNIMVSCT